MITKPVILWILLIIQIVSLAAFAWNVVTLIRESIFMPMIFANFALGLALIWVTVSHIKLLSKKTINEADPFA